jgi:hypothetical protein
MSSSTVRMTPVLVCGCALSDAPTAAMPSAVIILRRPIISEPELSI